MTDLSVEFCGVRFDNPFILPSGIITEIPEHKRAIDAGAGGVTLKSLTKERREGNPLPRIWKYKHGMLNSVGLRNAGIEKGSEEIKEFLKEHPNYPIIVSIFSTKVSDFVQLAERVAHLLPPLIELNLSCPNTEDELGQSLGIKADAADAILEGVKKVTGDIPLIAKLSPNVDDITLIAKNFEKAGVDAISAINTVGPGMIIDIAKRKPVLGNKEGGVSGPGIFPVALRCVYDIYETVKIPILGMGGVTTWQDAVAMMMAGATLVGVGTATYMRGMNVYEVLKRGLSEYMEKEHIKNIKEIVGTAHE